MYLGRDNLLTGCNTAAAHLQGHRPFSSVSSAEGMPEMPEEEFHGVADALLETLHETMDALVENEDVPDSDVEYSQGVLTIKLGPNGTYVYNKQTPNRQIWMSSPVSGPVRYDYMDGRWIYRHDDHELMDRLRSELSDLLGKDVSDVL
ncbi:probable frataxin, mitochondrial [Coccomyxa sp. Obi]|nr:probable frataxin, mitochondrial [Coccomyxa sp. Obi]